MPPTATTNPAPGDGPVQTVSIQGLDAELEREHVGADLAKVGLQIVYWLVGLIGVVLVLVTLEAALTYPSASDISSLSADRTKSFDNLQQARTAWFGQVKDLLQLMLVSLLVPLLSSVIGYIFGRRSGGHRD
jgi:hypothetical protein